MVKRATEILNFSQIIRGKSEIFYATSKLLLNSCSCGEVVFEPQTLGLMELIADLLTVSTFYGHIAGSLR
jgi:hypothetical protein